MSHFKTVLLVPMPCFTANQILANKNDKRRGLSKMKAISTYQIVSFMICSICLIGKFGCCYVAMETTNYRSVMEQMLENTEGAIKNGQFRETGNIGYTRLSQTKQKHNTICVGHHYTQTNTHNVNKI